MVKNSFASAINKIQGFMRNPAVFVRDIQASALLEDFFVSAIAAILAIRLYLQLTGFPQLGFGPLHIAHMLWGGLLMLIALVLLMAFLDHRAKVMAAVLGGLGFGTFIDELGKFITQDNDYFFQPTVALIYIVFVLMYFAFRAVARQRPLSKQESLANVFDIAKQGSLSGLDQEKYNSAMKLLQNSGPGPLGEGLESILQKLHVEPSKTSRPIEKFKATLERFYEWAASRWWFSGIVITFFAFTAITSVSAVVAVVEWSLGLMLWVGAGTIILLALILSRRVKSHPLKFLVFAGIIIVSILVSWAVLGNIKGMPLTIIDWAQLIFPAISGLIIVIGILELARSRLQAYLMFRRAILISIFFTQVLSFYEQQFLALLGLALNILILIALRYMIRNESMKKGSKYIT